jgi:integrase
LLLSGARLGEVLGLTWDQLDLAAGVWTKPSSHTKQKREHRVPLSAPARQLLVDIHATSEPSPYVFRAHFGESRPAGDIRGAWAALCKTAGISGVRIHDLRHTYASMLASAGLSLPVIGALLGHTKPQTTARYAHLFDDPLRQAVETVGAIVTGAARPTRSAEIVPLKGGGSS